MLPPAPTGEEFDLGLGTEVGEAAGQRWCLSGGQREPLSSGSVSGLFLCRCAMLNLQCESPFDDI